MHRINPMAMLGLGFMCAWSSVAAAYPGGAVVSAGTNPVAAYGGEVLGATSATVMTASADQDFVITDVNLMPRFDSTGCRAMVGVTIALDTGGSPIAQYQLSWEVNVNTTSINTPSTVDSHLNSGLRVPAGTSVLITLSERYVWGCGAWGVTYTLSGYHAQP